jgi:hypothetical protein
VLALACPGTDELVRELGSLLGGRWPAEGEPGGEEAGARAGQAEGQPADERDEERRAHGFVGAERAVRGRDGERGRQEVGVERAVVGLVPEGRRQLAREDVPRHQQRDGVVVRDRLRGGHEVQRPARDECRERHRRQRQRPAARHDRRRR